MTEIRRLVSGSVWRRHTGPARAGSATGVTTRSACPRPGHVRGRVYTEEVSKQGAAMVTLRSLSVRAGSWTRPGASETLKRSVASSALEAGRGACGQRQEGSPRLQ